MSDGYLTSVDAIPERRRIWLKKYLRTVERTWRESGRQEINEFLPPADDPLRGRVLVELIQLDQKQRFLRHGDIYRVEDYLRNWPELLASREAGIELLASECLLRAIYSELPTPADLQKRFPQFAGEIHLADIGLQAKAVRISESFAGTGRFFLIRRIGRGGMGIVYEAFDRERRIRSALKVLPVNVPSGLYRFKREFRALAEIVHPNVVQLFELISTGDRWFFTMELIDGLNFSDFYSATASGDPAPTTMFLDPSAACDDTTQTFHSQAQHVDFQRLRDGLRQLSEGVCALHDAGILHRDIKPSNVLVTRSDSRVVLLDFGLVLEKELPADAAMKSQPAATDSETWSYSAADGPVVGTVAYMSPEQATGRLLSQASDWYAVGVMLYEVLTGRLPFAGSREQMLWSRQRHEPPAPSEICSGIPSDLDSLCVDLLRLDPARRPNGKQILARLNSVGTPASREVAQRFRHGSVPFVGRQEQLQTFQETLAQLLVGRTVAVHVHGRSGAGKTTLVQEFLSRLASRGDTVVLSGRCYERESVPYKALDSLIDSLTRYLRQLATGGHKPCCRPMRQR